MAAFIFLKNRDHLKDTTVERKCQEILLTGLYRYYLVPPPVWMAGTGRTACLALVTRGPWGPSPAA